jgi:hypothetical protein
MIGKLALIAALVGSATGAAVVLADEPAVPAAPRVPAVATPATRTPSPPPVEVSDLQPGIEVPDPDGGAPWVLRRFTGVFPADKRHRANACIQLGRRVDGRFGWLDGHGTFTTPRPGSQWSTLCIPPSRLERTTAVVTRWTTIALEPGRSPRPRATVEWGVVAPDVTGIAPAGDDAIAPQDGLVLRVRSGEARPGFFTGEVRHADGRTSRFNRIGFGSKGSHQPQTVAAVAPDPAGGTPWGLLLDANGRCLRGPGLLVGTRLGYVQADIGLFVSSGIETIEGCNDREPTRAFPMRIDTLIGGGEDDGAGRIERRVDSARIVFSGRVHPDVVSVTIRTPRDVRTLVPSKQHAILAVYDGRFPGGKVTATAHFKDGHEVTRTLYSE